MKLRCNSLKCKGRLRSAHVVRIVAKKNAKGVVVLMKQLNCEHCWKEFEAEAEASNPF